MANWLIILVVLFCSREEIVFMRSLKIILKARVVKKENVVSKQTVASTVSLGTINRVC